ncbi:hypothetical protein [Paenibacillus sp. AD87]|uniref:hypothetical protein n=1 Tax=Paenibacillus sp. AD87 TaxID=1528787 RepID=UPI0018D298DE|nr:hypothetical protein [Paenibacillus sp. AD87]
MRRENDVVQTAENGKNSLAAAGCGTLSYKGNIIKNCFKLWIDLCVIKLTDKEERNT